MNIWPWRSRPVITPFMDNFSGRVHRWPGAFGTQDFSVSIPPNVFIVPSSIYFRTEGVVGIRGLIRSWLYFQRGEIIFAGTHIEPTPSDATTHTFISPIGGIVPQFTTLGAHMDSLPYPLFLYPNDRLFFHKADWLAGDISDHITIHGKFWEVH